ncbi:NAM domain-containing protein [Cephalotus follicularis]|uniref:NAM domain-containing protein n=1 Tax=Cephalotus follicularis TaxID=3775 RepID=A0A1Q3D5T8_CEPFO|nr:NAM domain-containing protein [Cephalotus follicularis]
MAKTSLPPGFRFHPTDVELIKYYLKRKVLGKRFLYDAIAEVDIYKYAPWDLPDKSSLRSKDLKWYFFCSREKKYASGARMNRATDFGYWKTTGKDRSVRYNNVVVGMIKTLVFHRGKAPKGDRTDWVMHEYRLEDKDLADKGVIQDSYVLSVIFQKDGPGPNNGAQYGAPFVEEEWSDDEEVGCVEASAGSSDSVIVLSDNHISPVATMRHLPEGISIATASESCLFDTLLFSCNVPPPVSGVPPEALGARNGDDLVSMLASFTDDGSLVSNENNSNELLTELQKIDNLSQEGNAEAPSSALDGNDLFEGLNLGDLDDLRVLSGGRYNFSSGYEPAYTPNVMLPPDPMLYLELYDLDCPLNYPGELSAIEHIQTDGIHVDCNYHINTLQPSYPVNSSSDLQHVSGLNQSSMSSGGSHEFVEGHVDVFHEGL